MPFAHTKTNEELSVQVQQKTDQLNLLAGKIAEAEQQITTYKDLSSTNTDLQSQVTENQTELDKLRVDLTVIKQALTDLESAKGKMEDEYQHDQDNLTSLKQSIVDAQTSLNILGKKQDELAVMMLKDSKDGDVKLAEKNKAIDEAQVKLDNINSDIAVSQKSLEEANKSLLNFEPMLQARKNELDKVQNQIDLQSQDLKSVQQDIIKVQADKKNLEETAGSMKRQIEIDRQTSESALNSRQRVLEAREGECSVKEKWLENKTSQLQTFKAELEQFHGKPINVKI